MNTRESCQSAGTITSSFHAIQALQRARQAVTGAARGVALPVNLPATTSISSATAGRRRNVDLADEPVRARRPGTSALLPPKASAVDHVGRARRPRSL